MAFLRFSRDKRGYEHFYLVEPTANRRGKVRARVLYWFRTPPNVRVGREPFDRDVRKALEAHNPRVAFDWRKIVETPIPSADAERWRERRRAERSERHKAAERNEVAGSEVVANEVAANEVAGDAETAEDIQTAAARATEDHTAEADVVSGEITGTTAEAGERRGRRRRRRHRHRNRSIPAHTHEPAIQASESAPETAEPTDSNGDEPN